MTAAATLTRTGTAASGGRPAGATLAASREPTVLIPASLAGLYDDAAHLERQAAGLEDAAAQVERQTVSGWLGEASLGWDECRPELTGACTGVGGVYRAGAEALRAHAQVVELARELVEVAIALWERGAIAASNLDGVCRPLGSGLATAPWSGPGSGWGSTGWARSQGAWTSPLWQAVRAAQVSTSPFGAAGSAGSREGFGTSSSVVMRPSAVPGLVPAPAVVPGADLCAAAEQLLAELQAMVARSAAAVAAFLDECSAGLPDGLFHLENVALGVWDWVWGLGEMWVRFNVIRSMADADGFGADVSALVNGLTTTAATVWERPEDFNRVVMDEQGWLDDPARWMGRMAPDAGTALLGLPAGVAQARRLTALLQSNGAAAPVPAPRVFTSRDPLVADVAASLDEAFPGRVSGVNTMVRQFTGHLREVDVELGDVIVQVKSGSARRMARQITDTIAGTGRPVVALAPTMRPGAWHAAATDGVAIARTMDELIAIIREIG